MVEFDGVVERREKRNPDRHLDETRQAAAERRHAVRLVHVHGFGAKLLLVVLVLLAQLRDLSRQPLHLLGRHQRPVGRVERDEANEDCEQDDGDAPVARQPVELLEQGEHGPGKGGESHIDGIGELRVLTAGPNQFEIVRVLGPGEDREGVLGLLARREGAAGEGQRDLGQARIDGLLLAAAIARRGFGKWNRRNCEIFVACGRPAHAADVALRLLDQSLHRRAIGLVGHVAHHLGQVGRGVAEEATPLLLGILRAVEMDDETVIHGLARLVLDGHGQGQAIALRLEREALLDHHFIGLGAEHDGVLRGAHHRPSDRVVPGKIGLGERGAQGRGVLGGG